MLSAKPPDACQICIYYTFCGYLFASVFILVYSVYSVVAQMHCLLHFVPRILRIPRSFLAFLYACSAVNSPYPIPVDALPASPHCSGSQRLRCQVGRVHPEP